MNFSKIIRDTSLVLNVRSTDAEKDLKAQDEQSINGFIPIILRIARLSSQKGFIGTSVEDRASVYQWLEYSLLNLHNDEKQSSLKELNLYLKNSVYFVSNVLTIADLVLYLSLYSTVSKLSFQDKEFYIHLSRWFKQVQSDLCSATEDLYPKICFSKTKLYT